MNIRKYSHVIWDWNGTLLDDVAWCIKCINIMLARRGISTLQSLANYHNAFCFPIIRYYENVGFNFNSEAFEDVAKEYIALYHGGKSGNCGLHPNAEATLRLIHQSGATQIILSASETDNLLSQISEFNIAHYFDEMLGLSDIYAKSKVDIGLDYMARKGVDNALLIGDTQHDYEVAQALGADCVLVSSGHQSKDALLSCGVPVLDDISYVSKYISGELS
ncbi:MAG: HAD hydrolase-like protein [Defluviitaleaceae bacterium]|nr:HAD hydrolase-like protein [Defluviitaleaceae bacterium]